MDDDKLLVIAQLVGAVVPQLLGLVASAIAADATGDQATLDALHAQAIAAADALKPVGQ